jgi:hypothetical protein
MVLGLFEDRIELVLDGIDKKRLVPGYRFTDAIKGKAILHLTEPKKASEFYIEIYLAWALYARLSNMPVICRQKLGPAREYKDKETFPFELYAPPKESVIKFGKPRTLAEIYNYHGMRVYTNLRAVLSMPNDNDIVARKEITFENP